MSQTPDKTWIVLRRDLSETVKIETGEDVWMTMVLDEESGRIVGNQLANSAGESLEGALAGALRKPLAGAPPGRPATVWAEPGLAAEVESALASLRARARVHEERIPDWAVDVIDGLTAHLSGRRRTADWPEPEDWSLLYQQAAAYLRAKPWERYDDSLRLRVELKLGQQRTVRAATILGNAGVVRGLALHPGETVPPQVLSGDTSRPPPAGTVHFSLGARDGVPADIVTRAGRYGWSEAQAEVPVFLSWSESGGGEIERGEAMLMTVALAAAVAAADAGAGLGYEVKGELIVAGGRRARYRARFESNDVILPPGLTLYAGELDHDLIPDGAVIGLGGIPWSDLEMVRSRAAHRQSPPREGVPAGEGLPVLLIGVDGDAGERVARKLAESEVHGVALVDAGRECLIVILTEVAAYAAGEAVAGDLATTKFKRRLRTTGGWHAVLVAPKRLGRTDTVFGLFECVLSEPEVGPRPRKRTVRRQAGRRRRR